ncbi:MAG: hypothetical protein MUF60_03010 [Vicinamibacterales bacterium]|jgi:alkyl hydroperoxide reductase subunit AhpF|nr:hypothetical protein [Vicinamibacterales bacterium]
MSLISDAQREQLRQMLAEMTAPVVLRLYTQTFDCDTCADTRQVLDLLAGVNDKITIDERNLVLERDEAAAAGIDRAPTILVLSAGDGQPRDVGVRFVGAPLGYEFTALVDAILLVSRGDAELSDASRLLLASVTSPMTLQVFTTPT